MNRVWPAVAAPAVVGLVLAGVWLGRTAGGPDTGQPVLVAPSLTAEPSVSLPPGPASPAASAVPSGSGSASAAPQGAGPSASGSGRASLGAVVPGASGAATAQGPASSATGAAGLVAGASVTLPIRAAFYYPWFPEAWKQKNTYPFTNFSPQLYDGTSPAVIDRQIADLKHAGVQAGIASWWGVGSRTDTRIPLLLQRARKAGFRWTLYYEREGTANPTSAEISSDLAHIRAEYAGDPAFLRVGGRAVLFVYGGSDGCEMARRWANADHAGFHIVLKVFQGFRTCDAQPEGWHQYAPAKRLDVQKGYSAAVSPGFWLSGEPERLARDKAEFLAAATQVATSQTPWQLVTTYNEWGEGTAVESAAEWASASGRGAYIDMLHDVFAAHPLGGTT